jgi:hypothetical protein
MRKRSRRSSALAVCVALFAPHAHAPAWDPAHTWPATGSTGSAAIRTDRAARVDTCATLPPATDTIQYRVYATLEAPARKGTLPASYVQSVLDGLRHGFVVPNPLTLGAYAPFVSGMNGVMTPAVFGEVEFTLDARGRASDIHLTQSSLSGGLDRAIYDAPRHADSLDAFPPQIGVPYPGKIRFFVALTSAAQSNGYALPFFAVRMPAWRPGSAAALDPRHDWRPTFPVTAFSRAVGDSVAIQFVVDEQGVPIRTTMRLLDARYVDYARLVIDAALKSRYVPATAAGCAVKGLISRSWKMTITREYTS